MDKDRHSIHPVCKQGVARAGALAKQMHPSAIIFTGWSSIGGRSEAQQMIDYYRTVPQAPRALPLVLEPKAVNTAENATRSLELAKSYFPHTQKVIVFASIRHLVRAPYMFTNLYRRHGLQVRYRWTLRPLPSWELLALETGGIRRARADRRRARDALPTALQEAFPPRVS